MPSRSPRGCTRRRPRSSNAASGTRTARRCDRCGSACRRPGPGDVALMMTASTAMTGAHRGAAGSTSRRGRRRASPGTCFALPTLAAIAYDRRVEELARAGDCSQALEGDSTPRTPRRPSPRAARGDLEGLLRRHARGVDEDRGDPRIGGAIVVDRAPAEHLLRLGASAAGMTRFTRSNPRSWPSRAASARVASESPISRATGLR